MFKHQRTTSIVNDHIRPLGRVKGPEPSLRSESPQQVFFALQRTVGNAALGSALRAHRPAVLSLLRSPGQPLPSGVRDEMQARLGADLSDVRIHTGAAADQAAESMAAEAFTCGSHVVFRQGRYDPSSLSGRRTLAHELTHVLQQRSGPVPGVDAGDGLRVSQPHDAFEQAAQFRADQVMQGFVRDFGRESPAAPATPTTVGSAIQRWSTVQIGRRKFTASKNTRYLLHHSARGVLWVHEDTGCPEHCVENSDGVDFTVSGYRPVQPKSQFYQDCLHTAEELMHRKRFSPQRPAVRSRVVGTRVDFGDKPQANIEAAQQYSEVRASRKRKVSDVDEAPKVGQAFAIVRQTTTLEPGEYPYHAAAVVAVDGPDRITLEVFAGTTDARTRNTEGAFGVYQTGDSELSFHGIWQETYATKTKSAITVTLERNV